MARLVVPNSATLHLIRRFVEQDKLFEDSPGPAVLEFHPQWAHMEPIALAMISAWGAWWRARGKEINCVNLSHHTRYAARMRVFDHLGVDYHPPQVEHEEAGRFLPVTRVQTRQDVGPVIGDISALLHLHDDPESLAAVQYCVSELLRNVLEHSGSPEGAFVCAHRYTATPHRVSIAVADCGQSVPVHLGQAHPEAHESDEVALGLAMRPGVTGAIPGPYGTTDNAGAGLFITRCISKGTGGYFCLVSSRAIFRQRRARENRGDEVRLYIDPYEDPRHDLYRIGHGWHGTAVGLEIRTDRIADYDGFFQWIFRQIPSRRRRGKIRFT